MRRREQDGDSYVLRQSLDAEAEGPSTTDGDNDKEIELEPKHKIFLSHSGLQKDFTEQLCVDLERCHYYPFFDKRDRSLPKGRKFPELIFQAAKQCQVAVLILSEDFFMRTKWPMLELEAFVEALKKDPMKISILPIYLGIPRHECIKNEARRLEWITLWREWAKSEERIDVEKWVEALKVLGPSNGIEYVQSLGEVSLREQIVSAVRDLVSPEITWSVGQIQGRTRICEAICKMFERTKPSPLYNARVVGIYGMGGVGKTTFCKVLCDEFSRMFKGKVCHGELGKQGSFDLQKQGSFDLQKQVLRSLTDMDEGILTHSINEDMTTNLLKQCIRQHQVFLALDNVWPEFMEEAKVYLRAGFHFDSIVMVTARSIDMLTRLNIDESDCLEMPELEEDDAKHLFLHHAAPLGFQFKGENDKQNILDCVRKCKFQKGGERGEHFHPLALKVLGAQLGSLGLDPQIWVENLSHGEVDMFNPIGEKAHPLFSILRRGYDSLSEEDKLFHDSVLAAGSPGSQVPMCQAEGCEADLSTAKHYHRRHKVCEFHSKEPTVIVGGHTHRFCQQCSRFHHLGEFDEGKRSCRKRLADHDRRRRKQQPNASTSGGTQVKWDTRGPVYVPHENENKLEVFARKAGRVIVGKLDELSKTVVNDNKVHKSAINFKESGLPNLIGDNLVIDLSRDLLSVSPSGYVIRTSLDFDGHGVSQPCILKRCDVVDQNPPDLARLQHPQVVHLVGFWIEEKYLFLVMEALDGDLAKFILRTRSMTKSASPLSLHIAVDLMLQIAEGMLYLHFMGVSYPLKCDNVLYKLTDRNKTEAFRPGDVVVKLGGLGAQGRHIWALRAGMCSILV